MTKIIVSLKANTIEFIPTIEITDPYPLDETILADILRVCNEAINIANAIVEEA